MSQPAPTIYPALLYNDPAAAIAWLVRAFGFAKLMDVPAPDGTVTHAELSFGSGVVMLGSAKKERGCLSPQDLPGLHQVIYVYVENVDEHHERARSAGAKIDYAPRETDYGSREYGARDLEGHYWSFGTYHPGV